MTETKMQMTNEHDLATFLGSLASQLRRDGLALTGMAYQDHELESAEFRTFAELAASLDQTASIMDNVRAQLCQKCRLMAVVEGVRVGKRD